MSSTETKHPTPRRRRSVLSPAAGAAPLFVAWQPLRELPRLAPHVFPSLPSVRWFVRQHRLELLEAGVIVELAGRTLVNVETFSAKALEIGRRAAAGRTGD
jgi:hypothetical protein